VLLFVFLKKSNLNFEIKITVVTSDEIMPSFL